MTPEVHAFQISKFPFTTDRVLISVIPVLDSEIFLSSLTYSFIDNVP